MQNKPYIFFGNRGSQKAGSDIWEKFPKNPVFWGGWRPLARLFLSYLLGDIHEICIKTWRWRRRERSVQERFPAEPARHSGQPEKAELVATQNMGCSS